MSAAAKPVVQICMESADGRLCVDVFTRPDGSFGFEEFRRDAEDAGRWRRTGAFGDRRFTSLEAARTAAFTAVGWLAAESR